MKSILPAQSMMRRAALAAASAMAALAVWATPAQAADGFDDLEVVAESDMGDMRGGFMYNGVEIGLGATVRTLVDGALALSTQVTWAASGNVMQAEAGDGFRLGSEASGMVSATDASGAIRVMHMSRPGEVMNMLVNSDNGRFFQQQAEYTITLKGFENAQANWASDLLGLRLGVDLANALTGRQ